MPLHYPGYNYCGPGTKNFNRKPKNRLDAACRKHDKAYKDKSYYLKWNKADEDLLKELDMYKQDDPIAAEIMSTLFNIKKSARGVTGTVTGKKRTQGKITDWAKAGKLRKPNSFKPNELEADHRGNFAASQEQTTGDREREIKMPKRYGKRPRSSKSRNRKRQSHGHRKSRRRNHSDSGLNRKIARVLNPAITYEFQWPDCARLTAVSANKYSLVFDPTWRVTNHTTGTFADAGFGRLSAACSGIKDTVGLASYDNTKYGEQYWVMKNYEKFRVTNMTSGTLFFKAYWVKARDFCDNCVTLIQNTTLEKTAALYPNQDPLSGGEENTFGQYIGSNNTQRMAVNKMTSLKEIKSFIKSWQIVKMKTFKLEPNQNHSLILKRRDFIVDPVFWYTNSAIHAYKPGDMKLLIRVDSTITGSTRATAPTTGADFMAYGGINVPYEFYTYARIARKTTAQERRFQYMDMTADDGVTHSMTDTPSIIGEPVQTAGAEQAMVG